jgi:hypothetical protein
MLSKLFKKNHGKEKINVTIKAFLDSLKPELFAILKAYLAPDIAIKAADAIILFFKDKVDKVW